MKKKIKLIIGIVLFIFVGFVAYGLFTMPKVNGIDSEKFSAVRVAKDLEYISKEHHSVLHPVERGRVRDYLVSRLTDMGGSPTVYPYDSIKFRKTDHYFDIGNVYCQFDPTNNAPASYILFIAHFDSRFPEKKLQDTVISYGAADDGYGVGVTLELLGQALKYRQDWKQGIKILFTDSEENDLDGIKKALSLNRELFDSVGFVVNIEARGVKGPALLFETSVGNSKVMELYKEAKHPYTYSLTTVVYRFLPNFTDFTVLKETYPGVNFSVIDNLHYYHTDLDNYSNINLKSIQHYGSQLEPMVNKYLTDEKYSDSKYLKADTDDVFFTIPGFKMFRMSKGQNYLFNSVVFALFCIALVLNILANKIRPKKMFLSALWVFLASLGILLVGEGVGYLAALISGVKFSPTWVRFIRYDWLITIISFGILFLGYILFFLKKKKKSHYFAGESVMGASFVLILFSAFLLFFIEENFFFLVPLLMGAIGMIFYNFTYLRIVTLFSALMIALLQFSFLYNLITALTIGSLGVVLFIAFFSIVIIVGLFECYLNQSR